MAAVDADLKVCRIASLTLVNAMIFHQVIAGRNDSVPMLKRATSGENVAEGLLNTWTQIQEKIDYVPIFVTATEIVKDLVGVADSDVALRRLAQTALNITGKKAALRHDLMGRVYHRLLADAKYFGAFYTTVPAATLLLKLTLDALDTDYDWSDVDKIKKLRIADLACGTGTLLKAALQTVIENHVRARTEKGELPSVAAVHKELVEKVLWGLDVVPTAIHLAGSALALHEPDVEFGVMNLITLPVGGPKDYMGSLELIHGRKVAIQADLYGPPTAPKKVTGGGEIAETVEVPSLNLCVMNPPFTRSVGGNLLFGHAPEKERKRMQKRLKKVVAEEGVPANITAGLGSVFVALAHRKLKATGQMALVLPRALLSGVAWQPTRLLLGNSYHVKYIVVSHQPGAWNFSENTSLSECLIIAEWIGSEGTERPTKVVNLWTKPRNSVEALTVASLIRSHVGASLDGVGTDELLGGDMKYGEITQCSPRQISRGEWNSAAAFAQTEVSRAGHFLSDSKVYVPGTGIVGTVALTRLKKIADIGPDRRDIADGFNDTSHETEYAALWGHDTDLVRTIHQEPNGYLSALSRAKKGRSLRDAALLWSRAGRLLVSERVRLNTIRTLAVALDEPVLSNTWWPIATYAEGIDSEVIDKILALWFNSSLGLLSLMAARVDTEGAWVELKKPILENLKVLDPSALTASARGTLVQTFDRVKLKELQPLPALAVDVVREQIDDAFVKVLSLGGDLSPVRKRLAAEPVISGQLP